MILLTQHPLVTQPVQIFFIVLVIILLAPLLLNKLKIPHIIGMIVAGVVIGPYGFNILDRDSSFAIFGQVGLLYLMFLAGLEIDMFHLRLNLKRGLWFGVLTLIIPLALGVLTSVYLLHLDWLTSLLLGSMYASHTLLAYPVAARYGITRNPAVLIAIVGTIIAVIGALVVLAVTVNVKRDGELDILSLLKLIVLMAIYCAAVLYAYPRITRWFFKTYIDKVTQYVYVLVMVFLSAWLSQVIGLEPVLGAFFAGIVLNRFVPASSPLMGSIEFVGNALFIPYFLISVGMMINVRVVFNGDTLLVALIMLSVAMVSKYIPAWIAQKAAGLARPARGVMFGLTTAHTAVALAVVTLGHSMGMFDDRILNSTVLVILITCAAAPIITGIHASRLKLVMLQREDAEEGTNARVSRRNRVNNTLIPLANARTAQQLVELAVLMRSDVGRHDMFALHVRSDNSPAARAESENALKTAQHTAAAANINITPLDRYDLNIATGILNAINERDITEVIMGLHRRQTIIDSFFGAKVEQLLKSTNKMLIITRCFAPVNTTTRIVVYVPPKAQYETGFSRWVRGISRLTRQLGCRVLWCCPKDIQPFIRGVVAYENYGIRSEFRDAEQWDDFILLANRVLDDDLLFVICARPSSVSFDNSMVEMPSFLQRYFNHTNLIVIYPEQFGENHTPLMSFADPLASDVASAPSPLLLKLRKALRIHSPKKNKD
jgi:Kef-type K+ transport system membrane component KefB